MSGNPDAIFRPGDLLNNTYRIEAILGRGGTSEVYRARSEISGRVVALKALRSEFARNVDYLALMTREEDVREIRHDGIVRYFDNQRTDDGTVYLVMDFVDGPGLDRKMKQGGMSAADLLVVAGRLADALCAAHAKKIVHRDLSPDNIILRNGNPAEAVIIDFGIAKDTNPGAATIVGNEFAGKYAYAAPEQLNGQTDERSDIYSLGALLLATYRGRAPDSGNNPMEVVTRKAQPLDTAGVPEPLKTLIDRMTHPDRNLRLQSAQALLAEVRRVTGGDLPGKDERTVIAPRPPTQPPTDPAQRGTAKPAKSAPEAKKSSGGLIAVLGLVALAAIGGGGFALGLFDGLLGPKLAVAEPYSLVAGRKQDGPAEAVGFVPSEDIQAALGQRIAAQGGAAQLTLARGAIAESWGADILTLVDAVSVLPEWRVVANDNQVRVTGLTLDAAEQRALAATPLPAALSGSIDIELGPRFLTRERLEPILAAHADCGALKLENVPPLGYPNDATVVISGQVAEMATQVALTDALTATLGTRRLDLETELLNPVLCSIDAALPQAPQGGFDVTFGFGDRPDANPTGRFFVGENPVIDVTIPASVTSGFLFVSALDVSGNVFHMLPNMNRESNSIEALRAGVSGPVKVRMAYGLAEAQGTGKLAFTVDDTALGKTRIVVIHAESQIFDQLRPTTESAGGYAQALADLSGPVRSLDSRILTTAKP
ncbi:serine/threonine-protein kinase [Paracoccaceae bacterium Fryx2]|nr:serine/threonine-protein kinase [Paracoccaceae bacterium Fryx2]